MSVTEQARPVERIAHAAHAPVRASMSSGDWAALLTLSVVWGASFFFYKILDADLHPFTIVLGRMGISALVLIPILYASGYRLPRSLPMWRDVAILGLIQNVIPFTLFAASESQITSALASIINATTPMFTAIVAHYSTRDEKLSPPRIGGIVLGFAGVGVLLGPAALGGQHLQLAGMLAALVASIAYGFAGAFGRRFGGTPVLVTATSAAIASTMWTLPLALIIERPWTLPMPHASTWLALFGIAILSSAFAYMLYYRILAGAGATNAALVTFLVPVSAVVLGVIVLHERVQWNAAVGLLVIFAGLVAIDGRLLKRR